MDQQYDIYRDSIVRFLGYSNEIGESFKYVYPRFYIPSYVLSISYVLLDTQDKFYKKLQQENYNKAIIAGIDTLLWQLSASVAIPGYIIHQVVKNAKKINFKNEFQKKWTPTFIGIIIIPFIIHPIDHIVEYLFDKTLRKIYF